MTGVPQVPALALHSTTGTTIDSTRPPPPPPTSTVTRRVPAPAGDATAPHEPRATPTSPCREGGKERRGHLPRRLRVLRGGGSNAPRYAAQKRDGLHGDAAQATSWTTAHPPPHRNVNAITISVEVTGTKGQAGVNFCHALPGRVRSVARSLAAHAVPEYAGIHAGVGLE